MGSKQYVVRSFESQRGFAKFFLWFFSSILHRVVRGLCLRRNDCAYETKTQLDARAENLLADPCSILYALPRDDHDDEGGGGGGEEGNRLRRRASVSSQRSVRKKCVHAPARGQRRRTRRRSVGDDAPLFRVDVAAPVVDVVVALLRSV